MSRKRANDSPPMPARAAAADASRRAIGLVLLALVVLPAFRLLDPADFVEGLMFRSGEANWRFTWGFGPAGWRTAAVLALAVVAALATRGRAAALCGRVGAALGRAPAALVAALAALVGAGLTVYVAFAVFDLRTVLNDASVQLIQARYFAAGRLAGPPLALPEFWSIQFMVQTAAGWVAQYPPGHAALLAGGLLAGGPWITMAAAVGGTGAVLVPAFDRLFPDDRGMARAAVLLTMLSPLTLGLAAGYMSHATLAAAASVALCLGLRASKGGAGWAVAAGACVGLMVTLRPVTGLVLGVLLTAGLWLAASDGGLADAAARPALLRRLGAWAAGGVPFAIAFGWFNARFFGSPLTLGYVAASGPSHGLGFHEDPWGRMYTPTDAIGNSSAELLSMSRELFGTAVPLVALIGAFLLLARRLGRGERLIVAWALLPLLASALYWHHDLVFGPRMLGEAVPAWSALALIALVGLTRLIRGRPAPHPARVWASDAFVIASTLAIVIGLGLGAPELLAMRGARVGPYPRVREERPSLVFVHESWGDRLGARLAARGLRLDSVRTLLTRWNPCQLEAGLLGDTVEQAIPTCRREDASDELNRRFGGLGLTGLLWLDDLPGLPARGVLWVRDLGPERNRAVLAAESGRVPLFALPRAAGSWEIVPYEQGLGTYWATPAGAGGSSGLPPPP